MKTSPLLSVGQFGVHLNLNPANTYSFVGTVVEEMEGESFATYESGIAWFKKWFLSQDLDFQREYAPELRNDIFAIVFSQD